jgi:hypothetical protein
MVSQATIDMARIVTWQARRMSTFIHFSNLYTLLKIIIDIGMYSTAADCLPTSSRTAELNSVAALLVDYYISTRFTVINPELFTHNQTVKRVIDAFRNS